MQPLAEVNEYSSHEPDIAIVYLHGFLSSPNAMKAAIAENYIRKHQLNVAYFRPAIPDKPSEAIPALYSYFLALKQAYQRVIIIGSSLGGFYAHHIAEHFKFSCVLINPLVDASERMIHYDEENVGQLENPYTQYQFSINQDDRQAVSELEQKYLGIQTSNKLVLLQMGDEVLDAHLAARYYLSSCCIIAPDGNHQFEGFENYTDIIFKWLGF